MHHRSLYRIFCRLWWYAAQRLSYESWRASSKKCQEYKWTEEGREIQISFLRDVSRPFFVGLKRYKALEIHHRSLGIRGLCQDVTLSFIPCQHSSGGSAQFRSVNWLLETNGGMNTLWQIVWWEWTQTVDKPRKQFRWRGDTELWNIELTL